MNKEQAIAALADAANAPEVYDGEYRDGLLDAIDILRALRDETPTVLTREKLIEIAMTMEPVDLFDRAVYIVQMRQFIDALLALGPVVVEGSVECPSSPSKRHSWCACNGKWCDCGQTLCVWCGTRLQGGEDG